MYPQCPREDNLGPGGDAEGQRLLLACLGGLKVQRGPILSSSGTVSGESHGEWGVLEDRHWARCGVVVGAGPGPVSGRRDDWLGLLQFPQSEPLPVHLPYFPSPHLSQPVGTDLPVTSSAASGGSETLLLCVGEEIR